MRPYARTQFIHHLHHLALPCCLALGHDVPTFTVGDETTIRCHESHFALRRNRKKKNTEGAVDQIDLEQDWLLQQTWKGWLTFDVKESQGCAGQVVYGFDRASGRAVCHSDKEDAFRMMIWCFVFLHSYLQPSALVCLTAISHEARRRKAEIRNMSLFT